MKSASLIRLELENQGSVDDAKYFDSLLVSAISFSELERRNVSGLSLLFLKGSWESFSGYYSAIYACGNPKMLCQIEDGQLHGNVILWYKNGKVKMTQEWNQSQINGKLISYREDGSRLSTAVWKNGMKIKDDAKLNPDGTIKEWPLILNDHTPGPHQTQVYQPAISK